MTSAKEYLERPIFERLNEPHEHLGMLGRSDGGSVESSRDLTDFDDCMDAVTGGVRDIYLCFS